MPGSYFARSMSRVRIAGLLVLAFAATPSAIAAFPERDIQLIVPFEAGGAVDTTSRIIAEVADTYLDGRRLRVVNRAGGGGVVGQTFVSRARPNGYTVLATTNSVITNPLVKGARYSIDDFRPVALYNIDPEVIVVPTDSRFLTVDDFLTAAREEPLNIVIAGIGTAHHMAGLAIEHETGATFNYLPIRGFGGQLQSVMGGHADGSFWPLGEAATHARAGSVRILALASDTRDPAFPGVPTFVEAGIDIPIWATFRGWTVPIGTPDAEVYALAALLERVFASDEFKRRMVEAGYRPDYRNAEDFKIVFDAYAEQATQVIDAHGLRQ